jgi:hypothetical protein
MTQRYCGYFRALVKLAEYQQHLPTSIKKRHNMTNQPNLPFYAEFAEIAIQYTVKQLVII